MDFGGLWQLWSAKGYIILGVFFWEEFWDYCHSFIRFHFDAGIDSLMLFFNQLELFCLVVPC